MSGGAAVCGVLCVLPGAVWRACVWLGSCALLSGAVLCWVLLCCFCCVLLSRAAVFSAGFLFALLLAFPWCSGLFLSVCCSAVVRLALRCALSRCVLVLVSAALCRLVLCCAMVRLLVLCCVFGFVAVLGSRLASSAALAGCCALSVLGRRAVSSCCAACGLGAVVPCAVFLGTSLFVAPLVWCCVGRPASLLSVWCSLAPLALGGVVCCCVLCLGVCCWAWLSSVVSWWLLVLRFGGAALWFGGVCLGGPLPCVAFCGAVLSCGGVLLGTVVCLCRCLCLLFVSCRCAFWCVCPGVSCCVLPVPSALCGAVLRCAGALALCCSCGLRCFWHLVLWCVAVCCAVSFGVLLWGAGSGCPQLSSGGVFRCWCPCLAAWPASL